MFEKSLYSYVVDKGLRIGSLLIIIVLKWWQVLKNIIVSILDIVVNDTNSMNIHKYSHKIL